MTVLQRSIQPSFKRHKNGAVECIQVGHVYSNTVNSKFHLIQNFGHIDFATLL